MTGPISVGLASGLVAGALSGLFGIGGGIVLVPLLALLLHLRQQEAQGITLAVLLLPLGLPAVMAYHKRFPIRWWLAGALALGFLPGVTAGAVVANRIDDRLLRGLFALFLAGVALYIWRKAGPGGADSALPGAAASSNWNGLWIGTLGGLLAGLFGVGGGVVMVPLLAATGLDQHEAQGMSLAVMLPPVGLPGVLVYSHAQGELPWGLMGAVVVGFAGGALAGARLAVRMRSARLARLFSGFVLLVAAALAWNVLGG